ncbi:hypothetical protein CRG98_048996, partial [Punica granatum]
LLGVQRARPCTVPCPELACQAILPRLPRLPTYGSFTRSHPSESSDSHGHVPDSSPPAPRLGNVLSQHRRVRIFDLYVHE